MSCSNGCQIDTRTFPELLLPLNTRKLNSKNPQVTLCSSLWCHMQGNPIRFVLRGAFDTEWIPEVHGGAGGLRASNCERHSNRQSYMEHCVLTASLRAPILTNKIFLKVAPGARNRGGMEEGQDGEQRERKEKKFSPFRHNRIMYTENDHLKSGKPS